MPGDQSGGAPARRQERADLSSGPAAPEDASVSVPSWSVWVVVLVCWLLSLASYGPAERSGPLAFGGLDWIAVMKVASRIVAIILLVAAFFKMRGSAVKRQVVRRLLPFLLLALWAMTSSLWSPLPAVSLGHGGELLMLVALALVVAMICSDNRNLSRILFHLAAAMLVVSVLNAGLWRGGPTGVEGPVRDGARPFGFVHPNIAGQVAGGGLILLVASYLIGNWAWTRWMLVPGVLVQSWVLFIGQSRTANGATFLALAACVVCFARKRTVLLMFVLLFVGVTAYLTVDPQAKVLGQTQDGIVSYVLRGQTMDQFLTATGRTEMWAVGWESFLESPLLGHGNWVMTETGAVDVWGEHRWQTAHNLVLHVLAGTGVIGGALLFWALASVLGGTWTGLRRGVGGKHTPLFVLIVLGWFLLIGVYELSFLGPVTPSSVFFFVTVGLATGRRR